MYTDEITEVRERILAEVRERIDRVCRVIRALAALAGAQVLPDYGEDWGDARIELRALRTRERELMAAEQPAIEPAELLLNGQSIAPLVQATGADESVSEPQPELRRMWPLLRLERALYSQTRPGTFADGCLHAARLDIDDIVVKLAASERELMAAQQPATPATSEAQEVLEKVRGIVVAWEISKHRSAGADSSGSMAQIQAALMP